jgi:oligoribonuclease (3'-5' exoribonuclease)
VLDVLLLSFRLFQLEEDEKLAKRSSPMIDKWPKYRVNGEVVELISLEQEHRSHLQAGVKHEGTHKILIQIRQSVISNEFLSHPI